MFEKNGDLGGVAALLEGKGILPGGFHAKVVDRQQCAGRIVLIPLNDQHDTLDDTFTIGFDARGNSFGKRTDAEECADLLALSA